MDHGLPAQHKPSVQFADKPEILEAREVTSSPSKQEVAPLDAHSAENDAHEIEDAHEVAEAAQGTAGSVM